VFKTWAVLLSRCDIHTLDEQPAYTHVIKHLKEINPNIFNHDVAFNYEHVIVKTFSYEDDPVRYEQGSYHDIRRWQPERSPLETSRIKCL